MSESFNSHEPIVWRLLEGMIVNVLVFIAVIVLVCSSAWDFIMNLFKQRGGAIDIRILEVEDIDEAAALIARAAAYDLLGKCKNMEEVIEYVAKVNILTALKLEVIKDEDFAKETIRQLTSVTIATIVELLEIKSRLEKQ